MNRRTAIVALAMLCLFVTGCPKVDKRITEANLAKIKVGMSRDEVEEILGPGEEIEGMSGMGSSAAAGGVGGGLDQVSSRPANKEVRWGNEYTNITVIFNRAGKVQDGANCITSKGLK